MRKIWLIKERLRKGHAITGLSLGQIVFCCLDSFFGPLFVAIGHVGFFLFSTNPIFGYGAILVIWILSKL